MTKNSTSIKISQLLDFGSAVKIVRITIHNLEKMRFWILRDNEEQNEPYYPGVPQEIIINSTKKGTLA